MSPSINKPRISTLERVFGFIVDYKSIHDGNSPTTRQIMDGCHLLSTSTVIYFLEQLELQGCIRRPLIENSKRSAAMIEVTGGKWMLAEKPA